MKKVFLWLLKASVGGALAFAILTSFCLLYYNIPVHFSTAEGATDYSWERNKFYSRGTEGFALGKTNNEGYVNSFDYHEGMNIDVLLMGSSHMEGYNVSMSNSTSAQLASLLGDDVVYNIGVSGHTFLRCCDNFEAALEKYKPQKYVVIETYSLAFSDLELEQAINGTVEDLSSHTDGLIGMLQKNQLLRLLYSQFSSWTEKPTPSTPATNVPKQPGDGNQELYLQLLNHLSQIANDHGVKLIIMHHSQLQINTETGKAVPTNVEASQTFAAYCEEANIAFLDMAERFIAEYNRDYILPHGFVNTSVGQGHLNKHGHRMIAEELSKIIGGEK